MMSEDKEVTPRLPAASRTEKATKVKRPGRGQSGGASALAVDLQPTLTTMRGCGGLSPKEGRSFSLFYLLGEYTRS